MQRDLEWRSFRKILYRGMKEDGWKTEARHFKEENKCLLIQSPNYLQRALTKETQDIYTFL